MCKSISIAEVTKSYLFESIFAHFLVMHFLSIFFNAFDVVANFISKKNNEIQHSTINS